MEQKRIPFDIKYRPEIEAGKYLVQTRDGKSVRIICWDAESHHPIVYLVRGLGGSELVVGCCSDGSYYCPEVKAADDLFLIPNPDYKEPTTTLQKEQPEVELFECPKTPIKDTIEVTSRMKYIDEELKPIAEFIMRYASWNLHKSEWNQPTIEVPLFRALDALIQKGKPYCGA